MTLSLYVLYNCVIFLNNTFEGRTLSADWLQQQHAQISPRTAVVAGNQKPILHKE